MVRLIALEQIDGGGYVGWVEHKNHYNSFFTHEDVVTQASFKYIKKDYKNYQHFRGVLGKFEPETFTFKKPIEVKSLSIKHIEEVWEEVK